MYSIKLGLLLNDSVIELKSEKVDDLLRNPLNLVSEVDWQKNSHRENCFKIAKLIDLKISQQKKELETRGLATNGLKSELKSQIREAMEAEKINVDAYVFQLKLEEETQCSLKIVDSQRK